MPEPGPHPAGSPPGAPGHAIRLHFFPPGWDLLDRPWVEVPLSDLAVAGRVIACLECGAVVVPRLKDVHEKRCRGAGS